MPNLSASFQYKLSARSRLAVITVVVAWLTVIIAWLTVVAMRLCGSTLMVVVWCWTMWLACAVVTTSWRTCPALHLVAMHRSCMVVVMVAWWNIYHNINLARATRLNAINIVCHCAADCHY